MIPLKLVETIFHKYWALVLPLVLVPLIVMSFTTRPDNYLSSAVVWTSNPIAGEKLAVGSNNPYLSPAQNQAQAVNDLLSTKAFKAQVAIRAGIIPASADAATVRRGVARVDASAAASGVNLVTISAMSPSSAAAQAVVTAIIEEYLARATTTIESDSTVSLDYYSQQMTLAQDTLNKTSAQLAEYVRANPRATDPTNAASQEPAYRALVQQVNSQTALVNSLRESLQAIQLRAASAPQTQASMFAVQDPASRPEAPLPVSLKSRYGFSVAGAMLGLFIGLTYLYVSYRTDHTIRSAEDLGDIQVPLLGSVPQLQPGPLWARYTPLAWFIRWRRPDFARKTAAAITTPLPATTGLEV